MPLAPNTALRRFPSDPRVSTAIPDETGALKATDLTHWPRMGLRGSGTHDWCKAHDLPLPPAINEVAFARGLRIVRLGNFELLVLSETGTELPAELTELPAMAYFSYREDGWAWFRIEGEDLFTALATCTSAPLRPDPAGAEKVVQTRFAGLDAVLVTRGDADAPLADLFFDIASYNYLLGVFSDRCPEMRVLRPA